MATQGLNSHLLSFHLSLSSDRYASVNWVAIGLGNCFGSVRYQAITLINALGYHYCISWRRQGVSFHWPHNCLFNISFGFTTKKTPRLHINIPVSGEFTCHLWLRDSHYWAPVIHKSFIWHDVIMRSEACMYMGQSGLWLAHVTFWILLCAKSLPWPMQFHLFGIKFNIMTLQI